MKNPTVTVSGAVGDALLELQALSTDRSLRKFIESQPVSLSFSQILQVADDHLLAVEHASAASPASSRDLDLADRSLAVLHAALNCVASSSDCRSSLATRAGLGHLLDELETAAGALRKGGDASRIRPLVKSLERELV
jgi:hypothetical protein